MSDDNMFSHYETTEMKMSSNNDQYSGRKKLTTQSSIEKKLSKNSLYHHEPNGSKSFGVGTCLLIIFVMIIGIAIALGTQDENPIVGAISCIGSLVVVFGVILGGKKP